mmetsp:Transcript_71453/g.213174  ORF Transcript_71453/g.213174 Transcript_71453/m.213174 type:complete len:360 (+) Transcript_71453:938-2017(+)
MPRLTQLSNRRSVLSEQISSFILAKSVPIVLCSVSIHKLALKSRGGPAAPGRRSCVGRGCPPSLDRESELTASCTHWSRSACTPTMSLLHAKPRGRESMLGSLRRGTVLCRMTQGVPKPLKTWMATLASRSHGLTCSDPSSRQTWTKTGFSVTVAATSPRRRILSPVLRESHVPAVRASDVIMGLTGPCVQTTMSEAWRSRRRSLPGSSWVRTPTLSFETTSHTLEHSGSLSDLSSVRPGGSSLLTSASFSSSGSRLPSRPSVRAPPTSCFRSHLDHQKVSSSGFFSSSAASQPSPPALGELAPPAVSTVAASSTPGAFAEEGLLLHWSQMSKLHASGLRGLWHPHMTPPASLPHRSQG